MGKTITVYLIGVQQNILNTDNNVSKKQKKNEHKKK